MGIRIGICGVGKFAPNFVLLFQRHPDVDEVVLCDRDVGQLEQQAGRFGIKRTFTSLADLCDSDVDAVALFTPRHTHGDQALAALNAGKHVYSAVPPAVDLAMLQQLVDTVERTGLIHMSGETSLYYSWTLYCQQRYEAGTGNLTAVVDAQRQQTDVEADLVAARQQSLLSIIQLYRALGGGWEALPNTGEKNLSQLNPDSGVDR